jgi:transketolase
MTNLVFAEAGDFAAGTPGGRNLHFGIREHAMAAVLNGLALSKIRPFGSSFLIFSDYLKPALRLSALMGLPVICIFTHDSIGLGQDGPTHQAVEQLIALRSMPGLVTLRPADANEVVESWRVMIGLTSVPVCLVLSRQKLPTFDRQRCASAAGVARGAYSLLESEGGPPAVILIGTGSEVALCVEAHEMLAREGIPARVVSMPSWELFEQQDQDYQDDVLPPSITARISVEAGSVLGWDRYVGHGGAKIGMHGFGASAPIKDLLVRFGFTANAVFAAAKSQLAKPERGMA